MTVSGNLGVGRRDCQRLVTKHLPADRIAISPGNVVSGRKEKERRRGGGEEERKAHGWRTSGGETKRRDCVLVGGATCEDSFNVE